MSKRGQMKLSFGMIFSIFLIIFFLAFAFFGIKKLISVQQETQINLFVDDLQNDIDKIWNSNSGSTEVSYTLPGKVSKVCFEDDLKNLIIYDDLPIKSTNINHLDLEESLAGEEKICFDNLNNKVSFYLEKDYGENYVIVSN